MNASKKRISTSFQKWLLLIVGIAFIVTLAFLGGYQTMLFTDSAETLLDVYIKDVRQDIYDTADRNLLTLAKAAANEADTQEELTDEFLRGMLGRYDISEVNIVNPEGVIIASTDSRLVGYDLKKGDVQSAEFLSLLGALPEYVQTFRPIDFDGKTKRKYAAVVLDNGGFIQIGYNDKKYYTSIYVSLLEVVKNRHVGEEGFL